MSLVKRIREFFFGITASEMVPGTFMDVENITETADRLRVPQPSKL